MADYDVEARQDAWEDLRPKAQGGDGVAVTITRKSAGTVTRDNATRTRTVTGAPVDQGCGLILAYKAERIDGTLIKAGDKQLMLAALDVTGATPIACPQPGDRIALPDGPWDVVAAEPFEPAGLMIYADLQLRR